MKHTLKILLPALWLSIVYSQAGYAQNQRAAAYSHTYKTGIGLRAGNIPGLSIKTFVNDHAALEGILHFRSHGFAVTGLYEVHKTAFETSRLSWFYGVGAHIGSYQGGYYKDRDDHYYKDSFISAGIDGILGLEYHFVEIPFTAGLDIKPFLDVVSPGIGYWDGALTLRYAF